MGICAVKGPRVMHGEPVDDELSPRSTSSLRSGSSGYSSASSRKLVEVGASGRLSFSDRPLWQRAIPKGRRCRPLSFSGLVLYDADGRQVELAFEPVAVGREAEVEEYFTSAQEFRSPRAGE